MLDVGPGEKDERGARVAMDVEVGDRIVFAKYAGTEIKLGSSKLLIMSESDVFAVVEFQGG